jgi:hypothetical protein
MSTNKVNAQAQMLLLLNKVQNLESQLGQRNDQGMDMLGLMNQLKSLQGKVPRREVPMKPQPNMNLGGLLAGLLGSIEGSKPEGTRCVWVSGLPDEYADADVLCNIFGNFGNVIKVQFTEKKPDGALIELDHPHSANRAIRSMNKQKLSGQEVKVSHANIERGSIKANDTKSKDFRQEKIVWRYPSTRKDSKFRAICMSRMRQLTPKLLVANIPDGKIDEVKKYMVQHGFTVKEIEESKRRTDDTKDEKTSTGFTVAKVELASTEEAISAVGTLHGTWPTMRSFGSKKVDKFGNSHGLVMSFMSPPRENKSKA